MSPSSSCAICSSPALEVGRYAGRLCVPHALIAAGVRQPSARAEQRRNALAAHDDLHKAFKARNRTLTDGGPQRSPRAVVAPAEAADPAMLEAIANVMQGLGGRFVRIGPRYGDMPPMRASIKPKGMACETCGSSRAVRSVYGVPSANGVLQIVQCTNQDTCLARARASRREAA